jgi:hypothetical protein
MFSRIVFACVALTCAAVPALAQGPRVPERLPSVAARLRPDNYVRVRVAGRALREGFIAAVTDSTITLARPTTAPPIRLADVMELEQRDSQAGQGAGYGAIVGGAFGLVFGYVLRGICEYNCTALAMAYGGLTGLALGTLAGAVIGSLSVSWERLYP